MKAQLSTSSAASGAERLRDHLRVEIARRCDRNPRYSLRAFARAVGLDHSTLSKMLRGARPFSERTIRRVGARLRLPDAEIERFVERERAPAETWQAREVRELTREAALLVSEWHHFAILELTRLEGFRADTRWIARVLGLTNDEVAVAVQRLLRLGLLVMRGRDRWVDAAGDAVSFEQFSVTAVRGLAERLRVLLASAPDTPVHYSATTLAVPAGRGAAGIERLERFRAELVRFLEGEGEAAEQVYRLEIALFPLTRPDRKE